MASAGCNFTKYSGPFYDLVPGKRVYYGRMSFQSTAGYDRTDLPKLHGGDPGKRPIDVFDGAAFLEQLVLFDTGSELDNNETNQAGQGTGMAKGELLRDSQRVRLTNVGARVDAVPSMQALSEVEMATKTSAPYPLTSMTFECMAVVGN